MLRGLVRKELLALTRDLHGLAALFLMPALFIVIMSLALKDVYTPPQATLPYAIADHDQGGTAQLLKTAWARHHGAPQPLPADWQALLRSGELRYVLVLEAGLSRELGLPSVPLKPFVVLLAEPAMEGSLFNSLKAELAAAAGELKACAWLSGCDAAPPAASIMALVRAEHFATNAPRPTSVQQNVPAWLVFGMFFVVASLANLHLDERSSGTLARLRGLGVPNAVMLASKALPYLGVNAVQAALMFGVGVWVVPLIGGDALSLHGIHRAALVLAVGAVSLAAVSLSLALSCAVRSHAQAAAIGPILNVLMAAVGGIMVPKFVMPPFMQRLAEFSPMNWGLEGLLTVLLRGGDVVAILPFVARLAVFAAVMLCVAVFLFRRP